MKYSNVSVASVEHVEPPVVVTSADLERRLAGPMQALGAQPGLLEQFTGIVERREWEPGTLPSTAAAEAGAKAIAASGLDSSMFGALVSCSVTRDYIEPSTASIVHDRLGMPTTCVNFDIGSACTGFQAGMDVVAAMIEAGQIDTGVVVAGEAMHGLYEGFIEDAVAMDPADPAFGQAFAMGLANLTMGSGSVGMVLARADLVPHGHRLRASVSRADTRHWALSRGQVRGLEVDARPLLDEGMALVVRSWREQMADGLTGCTPETIDVWINHQISRTHSREIRTSLDFGERVKGFQTFPGFGNIGPASVPFTLSKAVEAGVVTRGMKVALGFVGSGINCGLVEVDW